MEGGDRRLLRHGEARDEKCDKGSGKRKKKIDDLWVGEENRDIAATEATNLWRLLKHIATGASKTLAGTVNVDQGWAALQKLCQSMQPGVIANKGGALAQVSEVKPATHHSEMREKVTEIDGAFASHPGGRGDDRYLERGVVEEDLGSNDQADGGDAPRKRA